MCPFRDAPLSAGLGGGIHPDEFDQVPIEVMKTAVVHEPKN